VVSCMRGNPAGMFLDHETRGRHGLSCTCAGDDVALVTGPRRSLSLELSDARVYDPQIRVCVTARTNSEIHTPRAGFRAGGSLQQKGRLHRHPLPPSDKVHRTWRAGSTVSHGSASARPASHLDPRPTDAGGDSAEWTLGSAEWSLDRPTPRPSVDNTSPFRRHDLQKSPASFRIAASSKNAPLSADDPGKGGDRDAEYCRWAGEEPPGTCQSACRSRGIAHTARTAPPLRC